MTRADLEAELRAVDDAITNLYWTYTRTRRGKPPCVVAPELYTRRRQLEATLRRMRMKITEADLNALHWARHYVDRGERSGIYASSGGQAAQFRKLVRRGLLAFAGMGETDDHRKLPVALYAITDQDRAVLAKGAV